jgi:hypothetical protein
MALKPLYLDPEILRAKFNYDPKTGLISLKEANQRTKAGHVYGSSDPKLYIRVPYGKKFVAAHRVAWVLMTGDQPIYIDHINGLPHDNRWKNLRSVNVSENIKNRPAFRIKAGKSGPLDTEESIYGQHYY